MRIGSSGTFQNIGIPGLPEKGGAGKGVVSRHKTGYMTLNENESMCYIPTLEGMFCIPPSPGPPYDF